MEVKEILYIIGLLLALFYIITGFDDFIWDIITLTKAWRQRKDKLEIKELDSVPPKLIAVMIAAWHEENDYQFASFSIHDSEDVVHPYEVKVTNYLINDYPALQ